MKYKDEQDLIRSVKTLGINLSRLTTLYKTMHDENLAIDWISNSNRNFEVELKPDTPDFSKEIDKDAAWHARMYIRATHDIPVNVHIDNICITRILELHYTYGKEQTLKIVLGVK